MRAAAWLGVALLAAVAAAAPCLLDAPQRVLADHRADALVAAAPVVTWTNAPADGKARGAAQSAYQVVVRNAATGETLWDSGKVLSGVGLCEYAGPKLPELAMLQLAVRVWDNAATPMPTPYTTVSLRTGYVSSVPFAGASWISEYGSDAEAADTRGSMLRKVFTVDTGKQIRSAVLVACGLGHHEFRLNGKKVGKNVYEPAWSHYAHNCLYDTYDVSSLLQAGPNAIGVQLGNGMYNVPNTPGRYLKFAGSHGRRRAVALLTVTYTDGTSTVVASDRTWKSLRNNPITFTHIYGGEDYDARLEAAGWDTASFAETPAWLDVTVTKGPPCMMRPVAAQPMRVYRVVSTKSTKTLGNGAVVYDLGENFAGRPSIEVQGPAGATVKMYTGEWLNADGSVSQHSGGGPTYWTYTCRGAGVEKWAPQFSYTGFRWVQVHVSGGAVIKSLNGDFIYADLLSTGNFTSSNDVFNKVHKIFVQAVRSNMQAVFTDCPHREKLGWLEQYHLLWRSMSFNLDVSALGVKMLQDMIDSQVNDGLIPDIAPEYTVFGGGFRDSPEWGSSVVLVPYLHYKYTGDKRAMCYGYAAGTRYLQYLAGRRDGRGLLTFGLGDWNDLQMLEGRGPLIGGDVAASVHFYLDLEAFKEAAVVCDFQQDLPKWQRLSNEIKSAFNNVFWDKNTNTYYYWGKSETLSAMPLATGMAPTGFEQKIADNVANIIKAQGNHTRSGEIGWPYIVRVLQKYGYNQLLGSVVAHPAKPGYGYIVGMGHTSLPEAWDGVSGSYNHAMLGHIEEWFYSHVAGIDCGNLRETCVLRPGSLTVSSASANYFRAQEGEYSVSWQRTGSHLVSQIGVPPGSTAIVEIPTISVSLVKESGRDLAPGQNGILTVTYDSVKKAAVLVVSSGRYVFTTSA